MKTDNEFLELIYEKQTAYRRRRRERRQVLAASATVTLCVAAAVATVILSPRTSQPSIGISNGTTATGTESTTVTYHEPITTTMQNTTFTTQLAIGGVDSYPDYRWPFSWLLKPQEACDPVDVIGVDRYLEWVHQFTYSGGMRETYEANIYNLIKDFAIPKETIERLCAEYRNEMRPTFTQAEIDLLYTGTKAEVYRYFLNYGTIMVGDRVFTNEWLSNFDAEEYHRVGITAEQLEKALQSIDLPDEKKAHVRAQLEKLKTMGEHTVTTTTTTTTSPTKKDPGKVYVYYGVTLENENPNASGVGDVDPLRNNPFSEAMRIGNWYKGKVTWDEFFVWTKQFQFNGGTRPNHEHNIGTLMKEFNIPRWFVEESWQNHMEVVGETCGEFRSEKQIEAIYTGTELEMYRAFALNTTVNVDNSFYAIGWFADHTAEDYRAEGITAEKLQTALDNEKVLTEKERQYVLQQLEELKKQ